MATFTAARQFSLHDPPEKLAQRVIRSRLTPLARYDQSRA